MFGMRKGNAVTVGSTQEARLIFRRRYDALPKGWKRLGNGAYRTAYLSPSNVVYKICHENCDDHSWNVNEYKAYQRYRTSKAQLPQDWEVAETNMLTFRDDSGDVHIIAMEYIEGEHPEIDSNVDYDEFFDNTDASTAFRMLNLWDVHEGNFIVTPAGKKVIIDLGE